MTASLQIQRNRGLIHIFLNKCWLNSYYVWNKMPGAWRNLKIKVIPSLCILSLRNIHDLYVQFYQLSNIEDDSHEIMLCPQVISKSLLFPPSLSYKQLTINWKFSLLEFLESNSTTKSNLTYVERDRDWERGRESQRQSLGFSGFYNLLSPIIFK